MPTTQRAMMACTDVRRLNEQLQRQLGERIRAEDALRKEHEQLRRLLEFQEQQNRLIAYEIHDGLAQLLAGAQMHLRSSSQLQDHNPELARNAYEAGMRLLDQAVEETRRLIRGLRPPILDECGVTAAIEGLIEESMNEGGPKIEFRSRLGSARLTPAVENAVFRIVQEALTNARRYSKTDRVRVELGREKDGRLRLEVQDWGIGFSTKRVREACFGLEGIRQRTSLMGGEAVIHSAPGQGTQICVTLPAGRCPL